MNVLIISFTDLKRCPRSRRYITFLKSVHQLSALGLRDPEIDGVKFFKLKRRGVPRLMILAIKFILNFFRQYQLSLNLNFDLRHSSSELKNSSFDLIIARGIETWPFAVKISNGAKIIFDAPEYFPKEFDNEPWWRLFMQQYYIYLCNKYLKQADGVITVCDTIADEYHKNFGINVDVITNASPYYSLKPSDVDEGHIKIIHHGAAISSRKIELMLDIMQYTDERFTLDLMLVPTHPSYLKYLQRKGKGKTNVRFCPPVATDKIISHLNDRYDIGLYLLPLAGFNNSHALPNKFFEFIQARLALAISTSAEMANLVKNYDCGIVSADFSPRKMADMLNALTTKKIMYYKNQSHKAAHELSMEGNDKKFNEIVKDILYNSISGI
jgi:hypothetical protein